MKIVWKKHWQKLVRAFLLASLFCLLPAFQTSAKDVVIMLDPGHGGPQESGATRTIGGKTYREELITLQISKYIKQELETYDGVRVYMTRSTNDIAFMDRETRIKKGKNVNADAVVSIHINATTASVQTSSTGSLAAVPSYSYTSKSAKVARALGSTILKHLASDAGTKNNGYLFDDELGIILFGQKYKIPSMIIEHCYIDNPNDCARFLSTNAKMRKLAIADAAGIAEYYHLVKKGSSVPNLTGGSWKKDGNKYYYYTADGEMLRDTWQVIDGKKYYFNSSGVRKSGVFKLNGELYVSNKNGVIKEGLVTLSDGLYYSDADGRVNFGWQSYGNSRYYFDPDTGKAYKGLKKIGDNKYFFSKTTCVMQVRWQQVSKKKRLFFSPLDGHMMKNCWIKTDGKWYCLSSSGQPFVNTQVTIKGKTYKFNKNGVCKNYK